MAQTLTKMLLHVVFSTKNRQALIQPSIEPDLFAYMGGICRNLDSPLITANGTANHVHFLVALGKTTPIATLMMTVKKESSKWFKTHSCPLFAWQEGYGAFSIGESQRQAVVSYIGRQKQHHIRTSFEEEFVELLEKYGIEYDPKYLWN